MVEFEKKEKVKPSKSKVKKTVTNEDEASTVEAPIVKEENNDAKAIVSHINDTEELLEYVVAKINELEEKNVMLEEQIAEINNKPIVTIEDIEPKAFKRKIVLNRDTSGKIVGADVIDTAE